MIISASRRTDISAFYSGWFFDRLKAGYVVIKNPFNPNQERKISLKPSSVDGFVFWTKNPEPMIPKLEQLKDYPYYFLYTVNPYGPDLEKNFEDKRKIIRAFKDLSGKIGKERVVWRYDPIIISDKYSVAFHISSFESYAKKLSNYTDQCIISFLDIYRKNEKRLKEIGITEISKDVKCEIGKCFGSIGKDYGLAIRTCAEEIDFRKFNIMPARCIDNELLSNIGGRVVEYKKDRSQRKYCNCTESIDIGSYHTCKYDCIYCYAN